MNFESEKKGQAYDGSIRSGGLMQSKGPDEPWGKQPPRSTPGISQDVWKRYAESRLRSFGAR